MRAVIDEGVPRQLIAMLRRQACEVDRFPDGWRGLTNGKLLDRLEQEGFDCLITCDKNIEWQQSLSHRRLAVLVLPFQKLAALEQLAVAIATAVRTTKPGVVARVDGDNRRNRS